MTDLRVKTIYTPHALRTALLVVLGFASVTAGVVAWQLGGRTPLQNTAESPTRPEYDSVNNNSSNFSPSELPEYQTTSVPVPSNPLAPKHTTKIEVNGKTISLPPSGELHKTISDDQGNIHVDINSNQVSTDASNTSSTTIQLHSSSNKSKPGG